MQNFRLAIIFIIYTISIVANSCYVKNIIPFYSPSYHCNNNILLGYENWNIAITLIEKGYFGNPFGIITGPTSWTAPFYPFVLAILKFLFNDSLIVMFIMINIKNLILSYFFIFLYEFLMKNKYEISQRVYIFFLYLFLLFYHNNFFSELQDTWICFLLGILLMKMKLSHGKIGLIANFILISFPTSVLMYLKFISKQRINNIILILLISSILPILWITRNYLVFNRFIPIKANLFYELKQGNTDDDDGIYNLLKLYNHPFSRYIDQYYEDYGLEERLLENAKIVFLKYIYDNPQDYLKKVFNRVASFTFNYVSYHRGYEVMPWYFYKIFQFFVFLVILVGFKDNKKYLCYYILGIIPYCLIANYIRYSFYFIPLIMLMFFIGYSNLTKIYNKRCKR